MQFALLAFGLAALVHLGAQVFQPGGPTADLTQALLMPLLAMSLVTRARLDRPLVRLTLAALFFSWLGDTVPRALTGDASFMAMVGCFLLAQITYAIAFWPHRRDSVVARPALLAPYVVAGLGLVWWCADGAGSLLVPVIAYAAALVAMAALATGLGRSGTFGGLLFLLSDAMIAVRAFTDVDLPGQAFWVMLTYIAAQVLLVDAVLTTTRSGSMPRTASA
jgi:uncharacterized membrane protein YhhN